MYSKKYGIAQALIADLTRRKPLSRAKIFIMVSAIIVFAATAGLTVFSIEKAVSAKYEHAVELLDSNNYLKAKEEFLGFSGYRDSAAKAKECQDSMDFNYAKSLAKSGDYASAKEIFIALGDFAGARKEVFECDYLAAAALMDSGKLEEAKGAFLALGGYSDSQEQAGQCQAELDYTAATELLNQKDYVRALEILSPLKDYKDSAEKAIVCQNYIAYAEADKAFKEKNFYTAYLTFKKLGDFSDSAKRAAKCIQKKPKTGVIYRSFSTHDLDLGNIFRDLNPRLTFNAPNSGYPIYIKIYRDNQLISSVFIAPGRRVTLKLPYMLMAKGGYVIKAATGRTWFGTKEAFGDKKAYYGVVSKKYTMESGHSYTITLRVKKGKMKYTEINQIDF